MLAISGLDPSGGAGLIADVRTFAAFGVHGLGIVSAETVQNASGVAAVRPQPFGTFRAQLDCLLGEFTPTVTKLGLAGSPAQLRHINTLARGGGLGPIVLDPVLVASRGQELVDARLRKALESLLPRVAVLTPNRPELAALAGRPLSTQAQMLGAARQLLDRGVGAVFLKGGHARGARVTDLLVSASGIVVIERPRLPLGHSHGTGCHVASAIAALLARGLELPEACHRAVDWTRAAITSGFDAGPLAVRYLDDTVPGLSVPRKTRVSPRQIASNR